MEMIGNFPNLLHSTLHSLYPTLLYNVCALYLFIYLAQARGPYNKLQDKIDE